MRKIEQKRQGMRRAFMENGLRKNGFQILTKDFLVKGNYFPFDHHFTVKQTPTNLKIFFKKYFKAKQTELTTTFYYQTSPY
jgi:hypothetical protein